MKAQLAVLRLGKDLMSRNVDASFIRSMHRVLSYHAYLRRRSDARRRTFEQAPFANFRRVAKPALGETLRHTQQATPNPAHD